MVIDEKLLKDIVQYCELNSIEDINAEINELIRIGFSIVKYGTTPFQKMEAQNETLSEKNNLDTSENGKNKIIKNTRIIKNK